MTEITIDLICEGIRKRRKIRSTKKNLVYTLKELSSLKCNIGHFVALPFVSRSYLST